MRRKTMTAVAAAATILAIAGCGSSGGGPGAQGATSATLTRATFGRALTTSTSGTHSVHVHGDITEQGQHMVMNADENTAGDSLMSTSMQMSVTIPSEGSMNARLLHGVMYVNLGSLHVPGVPTSKPWVKVSLTDTSNPIGQLFARLKSSLGTDQFRQEFASISTLRNLGKATVRGVSTTHYVVTVPTAKLKTVFGWSSSDVSKLPKTLTYNVWVDGSSRPVEVAMSVSGMSMRMYFSKWGEPVHVVAPPASQVSSMPS